MSGRRVNGERERERKMKNRLERNNVRERRAGRREQWWREQKLGKVNGREQGRGSGVWE